MRTMTDELRRASDELDAVFDEPHRGFNKEFSSSEHQEIVRKLERMVELGELPPSILGHFNANPMLALQLVPQDLAKSFGLSVSRQAHREPSKADEALRRMRGILPIQGLVY